MKGCAGWNQIKKGEWGTRFFEPFQAHYSVECRVPLQAQISLDKTGGRYLCYMFQALASALALNGPRPRIIVMRRHKEMSA